MTQEQHHAATLDEVMALALAKTPSASLLLITPFLQQYYAQMHGDDLAERSPQDLAGAALAHLELAQERESGQALVHVYQPQPQDDGWHSPYAVAQIINDDMPFLVDSVTMEINRRGLKLHLIVHPQMRVKRDAGGRLLAVLPRDDRDPQALLESLIHVEMDRSDETDAYAEIEQGLLDILQDVRRAVQDWKAIQSGVRNVLQQAAQGHLSVEEAQESRDFLIWLLENHFTLLGARDYDLQEQEGRYALAPVMGTGLGILRDFPGEDVAPKEVPTQVKSILENGELLLLTKANARATVHRPGYLDYIGIKRPMSIASVRWKFRLFGARSNRCWRKPTSCPRATWKKPCCRSSKAIRAMNCLKSPHRNCSRSRSGFCVCRNARPRVYSCGATCSVASYRVSCLCRARNTTPKSACGFRMY